MDKHSMFSIRASFADITLSVDPINRERNDENDNVMAIFHEEQPLMWEYAHVAINSAISNPKGSIDFLDVGTGSGVWSILVGKNIPSAKKIRAIDKSQRAIQRAKQNARDNKVEIEFRHEFYNMNSAPNRSCKVIGLYAPYHLYPAEVEMKIPQHARGGVDGQQIFREQLCIANYHLAKGGILIFNQMCLGRGGQPEFTRYIPQLLEGVSGEYINIFPPMKTKEFLDEVYYWGRFPEYREEISSRFPELFYCNGIIRRNGAGEIKLVPHNLDLQDRSWADRILLHREIARHSF